MLYSLFAARHEVSANEGAICADFDFATKQVVQGPQWANALQDADCRVIVTGLTPALLAFVRAYSEKSHQYERDMVFQGYGSEAYGWGQLTLLHFDRESGQYWEQPM